jgi:endonuclease YncB( thermonuclease family)
VAPSSHREPGSQERLPLCSSVDWALTYAARRALRLALIISAWASLDSGLVGPALAASDAPTLTGRASVIDGDTIEIHGRRVRLHGIDAPESDQTCQDGNGRQYRCGQRAALALADKIGSSPVSCEQRDVDRYKRIVAICRSGGEDLNRWIVSEGWAIAYRRYSSDYVSAESSARAAKAGLWAGSFMPPEEWRRAKRRH